MPFEDHLISNDSFDALPPDQAMERLGHMIDDAADTFDEALNDRAIELARRLQARSDLPGKTSVLSHYFLANAFANKHSFREPSREWAWEIPDLEAELFELRRAVRHRSFEELDPYRRCQVFTNLANKLNSVGRPVEAIAHWDKAIAIIPQFAMSLGNRGHGIAFYGRSLYDQGHMSIAMAVAHESFASAAADSALFDSPGGEALRSTFSGYAQAIRERILVPKALADLYRPFSFGRSRGERAYRSWCLTNRLFLNPLNDLGEHSVAARDVLHLPGLTTGIECGPEPPALRIPMKPDGDSDHQPDTFSNCNRTRFRGEAGRP